jgi:hypothetical protein
MHAYIIACESVSVTPSNKLALLHAISAPPCFWILGIALSLFGSLISRKIKYFRWTCLLNILLTVLLKNLQVDWVGSSGKAARPDLRSMTALVSALPEFRMSEAVVIGCEQRRLMRERAWPVSSQQSMKRCLASGFVFLYSDQLRVWHWRQRPWPWQLTRRAILIGNVIASLLMLGFVPIHVRRRSPSSTSTHKTLMLNTPWLHIHTMKNTGNM